ncbi:hypothetical protein ACK8P5_25930 (plasmid) [Paenibacillus sp. EC2-1]|uniref:hypothetical protein n=1 Tax=Paenibacillus sp. EC2-1 TaxID=3388665 RepID=UPI003BEED5E5
MPSIENLKRAQRIDDLTTDLKEASLTGNFARITEVSDEIRSLLDDIILDFDFDTPQQVDPDLDNFKFSACVNADQKMDIEDWDNDDIYWGSVSVTKTTGILVTNLITNDISTVDVSSAADDKEIIKLVKEHLINHHQ